MRGENVTLDFGHLGTSCCLDPSLTDERGVTVCKNCGTVYGSVIHSTERRAFTFEEKMKRQRTYPSKTPLIGNRTTFRINEKGVKDKVKFFRLSKYQRSSSSNVERNFFKALRIIDSALTKLSLPDYIRTDTCRVYMEVVRQKLPCGRTILSFVGASLLACIRYYQKPVTLTELGKAIGDDPTRIRKAFDMLMARQIPQKKSITPKKNSNQIWLKNLIYGKCWDIFSELFSHISNEKKSEISTNTLKLFSEVMKRQFSIGKDPKGFIGGCIYYVFNSKYNLKITQRYISLSLGITDVTLRTRIKDLERIIKEVKK